jgi:hypothetical protein
MQIQAVLDQAPIDFGEEVVVYLSVPPRGKVPTFEIATKGKEVVSHRLVDLIDTDQGRLPTLEIVAEATGPVAGTIQPQTTDGPTVRSTLDEEPSEKRDEGTFETDG